MSKKTYEYAELVLGKKGLYWQGEWPYAKVKLPRRKIADESNAHWRRMMTEIGEQGWQLVTSQRFDDEVIFYFMRETD